jgi:hypothetical protein
MFLMSKLHWKYKLGQKSLYHTRKEMSEENQIILLNVSITYKCVDVTLHHSTNLTLTE